MKNHIIFKTIAVLLCTVSLLGIVGSGLGVLTLTEGNLYTKTVDQIIDERIQSAGSQIAHGHAARYASITLGETPEILAQSRFPHYTGVLRSYAYAIKDAEGNILEHSPMEGFENAEVHSFPISGQYIHTVNLMTVEQKYPSYEGMNPDNVIETRLGDAYLYSDIPDDGAVVGEVYYVTEDGHGYDYGEHYCGTAFYSQSGNLVVVFPGMPFDVSHHTTVTQIVLCSNDGALLYEALSADSVGYFTYSNDNITFVSTLEEQLIEEPTQEATAPEETVPDVTEVTVPETTEETVPETTAETVPETTAPEIEFYLEDNLPEENSAEVARLKINFWDDTVFEHTDEYGIGRVQHEDGIITFASYDPLGDLESPKEALRVRFWDPDGNLLLEAEYPKGVGEFRCSSSGRLKYTSDFPVIPKETVPEETVAETTEATVPETTEETVPETTVETVPEETIPEETVPETTEPIYINGKSIFEFEVNNETYYDYSTDTEMYAEYVYIPIPEYTVELYLNEDSLTYSESYTVLRLLREYRNYLLPVMAVCVLVFLVFFIYLCCAAARSPKSEEVRAGGLNRIPLDLYLILGIVAIVGLANVAFEGGRYLMESNLLVGCACAAGCGLVACALVVGFLFALAAQCKTPGGFWWRNSLCGQSIFFCMRFMVWLEKFLASKFFPLCGRFFKWLWKVTVAAAIWIYRNTERILTWAGTILGRIFRWIGAKLHRFLTLLPVTWQWLLLGAFMVCLIFATDGSVWSFIIDMCIVLYASHCYGVLAESTRRMSKGDLDTKVDDKLMLGCFKESAADLNALADVAVVAAQKQLKSERMKTELITNVSHDIKTPLTSIINYVDLLQKPHTEEEEQQYLEVLDRQSLRLKKLIDDLMEMSKASTGNMAVDISRVDAVEAVNQALGEFADKLDKAQLIPVFRHDDASVPMMADGRLVWRVMSNLLSNAVKYAMPGTRLYIDLAELDGKVVISLKNISRHELNTDAEELMERFVRGDESRNTEGSGLGLNIAKSLMELQKGSLQLLVDGDLFKVTLLFPRAE